MKKKIVKVSLAFVVAISMFFFNSLRAYAASWSSVPRSDISAYTLYAVQTSVSDSHYGTNNEYTQNFVSTYRVVQRVQISLSGYFKGHFQISSPVTFGLSQVTTSGGVLVSADVSLIDYGIMSGIGGVTPLLVGDNYTRSVTVPAAGTATASLTSRLSFNFDGTFCYDDWATFFVYYDYAISATAFYGLSTYCSTGVPVLGYVDGSLKNSSISAGGAVSNDTQQIIDNQEQIAASQEAAESERHEDTLHGWDDSEASGIQESQAAQLEGYEQQQDQAMSGAQGQIDDFTDDNFNTDVFTNNVMALGVVGTMFNDFWLSFGQYTSYFVLCLAIGVAGYIIKVRR